MKNKFAIVIICLVLIIIYSSQLYALTIAAGAKMWYVQWMPFFKDMLTEEAFNSEDPLDESFFKSNPTIMAGPTLSLLFGNFGISGAFNMGKFDMDAESAYKYSDNYYGYSITKMEVERYDIDLSLSYSLISQLKVFAGLKAQLMSVKQKVFRYSSNDDEKIMSINNFGKNDIEANLLGPGVGAGYSFNIKDFIIGANGAYVYLVGEYGSFSTAQYEVGGNTSPDYVTDNETKIDVTSNGVTIEPFIGFKTKDTAVILIGLRYQYMVTKMSVDEDAEMDFGRDDDGEPKLSYESYDTFIGGSLSISLIF